MNQCDYASWMTEWFEHHLKGAPAADWIVKGVPRIRMADHLAAQQDSRARVIIP